MKSTNSIEPYYFPMSIANKLTEQMALAAIEADVGVCGFKNLHGTLISCTSGCLNLLTARKFRYREELSGISEYEIIKSPEIVDFYHKNDRLAIAHEGLYLIEPMAWKGQETFGLGIKQGVYDNDGINIVGSFYQAVVIGSQNLVNFVYQIQGISKSFFSMEIYNKKNELDYHLSNKEMECLFYTLRGKRAKQVASLMGISQKTVEFHIENLKNKFNCHSKSELISTAIELGFFDKIPASILNHSLN